MSLDKITGQNFVKSQEALEQALEIFWRRTVGAYRNPDDMEHMVDAALDAYLTYNKTICWDVSCAHVANYLDESFEKYFEHESQALKLLPKLIGDGDDYDEARDRAVKLLENVRQDYEALKAHLPNETQGAVSAGRITEQGGDYPRTLS